MKHTVGCVVTLCHNQTIGHLSIQQWWWPHFYYVLKMSVKEHERLLALRLGKFLGCAATLPHNRVNSHLSRQKLLQQHWYYVLKISVNGVSTTFDLVSWNILWLRGNIKA